MKKITGIILILSIMLSLIPASFAAAETDYFFYVKEADECDYIPNALGGFEMVNDRAYGASGDWAMKAKNVSSTKEPTVLPLFDEDVYADYNTTCKLFIRVRGQDSIKWKVENDNTDDTNKFTTVWYSFEANEYKWILLDEIELCEGYNTVAFASYKAGLYFDKFIITDNPLYYPVGYGQDPDEGSGFSDIYPTPTHYPEKNVHPRVFINDSMLSDIRRHATGGNKAVFDSVKKCAKENRTGLLKQNVSYNNYDYNALECAKSNALMYLIEGDEAYANKAVTIMTNYMSTLKYNPPGSLMEIRGTGSAITAAAMVYDWCWNAECFTEERKENLVLLCAKQASKLECGWPPLNLSIFDNGHGGENAIMKDMFSFAIAVYDEHPDIYDMVGGRIFSEYVPAVNHHYEKETAFHRAGDDYGVYRFEFEVYMNLLLNGMGCGDVISDNQRLTAYQHIIRLRPDGGTFRDGDLWNNAPANGVYSTMDTSSVSFYCAALFDDPYLKSFYKEQVPNPTKIARGGDFSQVTYLIYNNPEQEERPIEELPLAIYSGDESGLMTVRTSWDTGRDSDAMAVSMKLPEMWYANHQHLDAGQFEIFYKGPLAIDSGMYQSDPFYDEEGNYITSNLNFGSDHHVNYSARTIAHNTITVYKPGETGFGKGTSNDGGQRAKYNYPHNMKAEDYLADNGKAGEVISVDIGEDLQNPSYTYQKADLTDWYSDKMSLFERSFMFLNFKDDTHPGAVVVFDRVKTSDPTYKKSWLLHSQNEPEVSGNITVIRRNDNGYNGKLINETLLPANPQIEKIGGEGKEYWVDGKNYNATPKNEESDESGNWRVEISPESANTEDYFLNVLTVSDDRENIERLPAELIETDLFYGVKVKDRVALFGKQTGKVSSAFSFEVPSDKELEFEIGNIAKGTWQVSSGSETKTVNVSERGAVLSFKGRGGSYTVTPVNSQATEKNLNFTDNAKKANSAYVDTYPCYYPDERTVLVYAKATIPNGYEVTESGVVYSKDKTSEINDDGVMVFKSEKASNVLGRFGIKIIDAGNKLKDGYFRTYVKYNDNGSIKTAYGNPVRIYEAKMNSLSIGGKAVEEFSQYKMNYEYILPKNWTEKDGFPEITPGFVPGGTAFVTSPTKDTMQAVITVEREDAIPKTVRYTVNFKIDTTKVSVEKAIALNGGEGIIKNDSNIYSAGEQLSKTGEEVIYSINSDYFCVYNHTFADSRYVPVMGYMQLDLKKIYDDLDYDKPVILRTASRFSMYDKITANAPISDAVVSIYDMTGFDWVNSNLTTRAVAADLSVIEGKTPIASICASDLEPTGDERVYLGEYDVDITEFVHNCIRNGNLTPTLGFAVDKPTTITNVRNRVVYWMYINNKTYTSYVVYNKFE